jgi:hypothetical protein
LLFFNLSLFIANNISLISSPQIKEGVISPLIPWGTS